MISLATETEGTLFFDFLPIDLGQIRNYSTEGVTFHNGNTLTPEDVEYSFERGMVQDYASGPQWMLFEPLFGLGNYTSRTDGGLIPLEEIKSKVEVDGQWVQFNLATPYEPFLQILSSSWGSMLMWIGVYRMATGMEPRNHMRP